MQQVDQERRKRQQEREAPPSEIQVSPQEEPSQETLKVTVKSFHFEGNTLISSDKLAAAVKRYVGRSVTYADLEKAAASVGEAYRRKGWTVRSFLPKQDIVDGIVTIRIMEAGFGNVRIEEGSYRFPSKKKIESAVAAYQHEGAPLNTKKLERALMVLDDLPGAGVSGRLQQGDKEGQTDLAVKTAKESLASGVAIADNQGSRSTGEYRAHTFLQLANPLGIGDQSSAYILYSEGLRFARFEETVPVGNDGWRVGVNTSLIDYEVLPSEFESLDAHGRSSSIGAQARYPVIRGRENNLYLNLNYDNKYYNNIAQEEKTSTYRINDYSIGLSGNKADEFFGGGNSAAGVCSVWGNVNLGTVNTGEDSSVEGGFQRLLFNISRQQSVVPKVSLYSSLSGQVTTEKKLDSSEKFYLGGPNGVRAYPVSEGSGVEGHLSNTELRWRFLPNYQLSAFYDYGRVRNFGDVQSYSLQGAGMEVAWQSKSGLNVKGTWARRIGSNPNPTSSGNDQDGSLKKDRFWLIVIWRF